MKKHVTEETIIFFSVFKWLVLSSIIGIIIGYLMSIFLNTIHLAEETQSVLPFPYYFILPIGLMLTVWVIQTFDKNATGHGTEKVIEAVHKRDGKIDVKVIPVKLIATVLTIFSGGSVGKEGPGVQIGAGAASFFATIFRFSAKDRKKLVICGISAGFASIFGTPIAGAIFGIEVLIVGIIMYDVLLPSFIAGFAGFYYFSILWCRVYLL
jgi:H+/Cl- antiporter ClcA